MLELSERDFEELRRSGDVQMLVASTGELRRRLLTIFWLFLVGGTLVSALLLWWLISSGHDLLAVPVLPFWLVTFLVTMWQTGRWNAAFKRPVLARLARQAGMQYAAKGFDPPGLAQAKPALFGNARAILSDLFQGAGEAGEACAFYEALLTEMAGRVRRTIFNGRIYAIRRRSAGGGETAIVPDFGAFNLLVRKVPGMERVSFESDPAFEAKFRVYATRAEEALALLGGEVRRKLLELQGEGRVHCYVGPQTALVAVASGRGFEPGGMFRSAPGEEIVRQMFDKVRASIAILRDLQSILG